MKVASTAGFHAFLAAASAGLLMANAITLPLTSRPLSTASQMLRKRVLDMNGSFGNGSTLLDNNMDREYFVNITLGGAQFEVMIDTGSSDLWVTGNVPEARDLQIPTELTYGIGAADGSIGIANLEFDDFAVPNQAYLHVVRTNTTPSVTGFLGIGPGVTSQIHSKIGTPSGDAVMDRIFRQDTSTPNFISLLLPRVLHDDAEIGFHTGQLTIGSLVPGQEAIVSAAKLPALVDETVQHWQTLLDANGIIGPNGEAISTTTSIQQSLNGGGNQLHVMFDSGFTFPQVSKDIADAIYGRVPNATFISQSGDSDAGYWRIPCDYELNISFVFAGVRYPVAPLDMTFAEMIDDAGNPTSCGGSFQANPQLVNHQLGAIDAILGMSFLRNVYILINFGDFVDGSTSAVAAPYIQLLSTTNLTQAHADFVTARLGGVDPNQPTTTVSNAAPTGNSDRVSSALPKGTKFDLWVLTLIVVGIASITLL